MRHSVPFGPVTRRAVTNVRAARRHVAALLKPAWVSATQRPWTRRTTLIRAATTGDERTPSTKPPRRWRRPAITSNAWGAVRSGVGVSAAFSQPVTAMKWAAGEVIRRRWVPSA